jgi:GNAT superfamily N-acetyltransferase
MSRILIAEVAELASSGGSVAGLKLAAFSTANYVGLAECYFAAYSPERASVSLAEAKTELRARLKGDHGQVLPGASPTALLGGQVIGSVQVVQRSIWDPQVVHPCVIALFVHPDHRGMGIATALLANAASRLKMAGFEKLALRTGDDLSAPAERLCWRLGFADLEAGEPNA